MLFHTAGLTMAGNVRFTISLLTERYNQSWSIEDVTDFVDELHRNGLRGFHN